MTRIKKQRVQYAEFIGVRTLTVFEFRCGKAYAKLSDFFGWNEVERTKTGWIAREGVPRLPRIISPVRH